MSAGAARAHAAVVGGGIVGLACACALQDAGYEVSVHERGEPAHEASFGNAGGIGASETIPMAVPGIVRRVPRWLLDPLGPLAIRWRHLPRLAPWLWRFWRCATRQQVQRSAAALAALLHPVYEDLLPLLHDAGVAGHLRREGSLTVYERESTWLDERPWWELRARHGIAYEAVSAAHIRELEPDLAPVFACGVRIPAWGHVADPYLVADGVAGLFRARQGRIVRGTVAGFEHSADGLAALRHDDGKLYPCDLLVIAAGAWSAGLSGKLGDRVLLQSERGYHLTLPQAGVTLNNMVLSAERSFVMTPMSMGLRLAGTAQFAGLEAPPDYRRADALAVHARHLFGRLDTHGATRWMGQRPSTPDSLPVIGRSPRHANVLYAFGHGHLGLTLCATTARLVAALATGRDPGVDMRPYDIARFS